MRLENEEDFNSSFKWVLENFSKKISNLIMKNYNSSKLKAEKVLNQRQNILTVFLKNFKRCIIEQKEKSHQLIHLASLLVEIVGFSPILFLDTFLLVPIQSMVMARLHKLSE